MSRTTNKFASEVRERTVRMVVDHERDHPSRWAAVVSIAEKIGYVPQTLHEWVKKAEVDSGKRAGVPTDVTEKLKADMMTGVSAMTDMTIKTPWHLWLVGVIAVLFNAIGAFDYVMSMAQGGSYMASAGMTPAQIAHYQEMPIWMIAVWTIGVWGAMLGSVLILLRNNLAFLIFAVSLAAFLVSLIYTYVLTDGGEIMGGPMAITSVVITALLLFFMWYSWLMTKRSVLR